MKLTNVNDCINKGYIKKNEIPLKLQQNSLRKIKLTYYIQLEEMIRTQLHVICQTF